MRIYAACYSALAVATAVALVCVRFATVLMSINIGTLFAGVLMLSLAAFGLLYRQLGPRAVRIVSLALPPACALVLAVLYAFVFKKSLVAAPSFALSLAFHLGQAPGDLATFLEMLAVFVLGAVPLVVLRPALEDR